MRMAKIKIELLMVLGLIFMAGCVGNKESYNSNNGPTTLASVTIGKPDPAELESDQLILKYRLDSVVEWSQVVNDSSETQNLSLQPATYLFALTIMHNDAVVADSKFCDEKFTRQALSAGANLVLVKICKPDGATVSVEPKSADAEIQPVLETPGSDSPEDPPAIQTGPGIQNRTCAAEIGGADVSFNIDAMGDVNNISKYIYGANYFDWLSNPWNGADVANWTLLRAGGNNWSTYNWETDSHNVGLDGCSFGACHQNLMGSGTPGARLSKAIDLGFNHGAAVLVTVPIIGKVATTETTGFYDSIAFKGSAFSLTPDLNDNRVYQDEFVNWINSNYGGHNNTPIFYSLDNEPALWFETHSTAHPDQVLYQELVDRSIEYARAIKSVANDGLVFGPALYGWYAYTDLQGAPDRNGRDFLDFYLDQMRLAEESHNMRLLDVLDLHWYSVPNDLQATRTLWDPTYSENSWIVNDVLGEPIRLLPRLQDKIARHYPGTKLSFSEYSFGYDGGQISGGIKQADVLGIFGREGIFAATLWSLSDNNDPYFHGAFAMYRNFDGQGGKFGDVSIKAENSNIEAASVYASYDSATGQIILIAINKTPQALNAGIKLNNSIDFANANLYQLTDSSPMPTAAGAKSLTDGCGLNYQMPPNSVTTIKLTQ